MLLHYKKFSGIIIFSFVFGAGLAGILWTQQDTIFKQEAQSFDMSSQEFRALSSKEKLQVLKEFAQEHGVKEAREFLKRTYPDQPADEHELIHIVGEVAFLDFGYEGLDFCDSLFSFGCYHGVVLEAVRQHGHDEEVFQNLARGCLDLPHSKTTITACIHGIGHGVMVVGAYDLLASYQNCDKMFVDSENLFFCYDGVSMENVMRRFEQEGSIDYLTSEDPFYPCNTVPQKYQSACVREHIFHARRVFYEKDTEKTAEYCLYFTEEKTRSVCFSALGNVLNQEFFGSPKIVIEECRKVGKYSDLCITKAASQYGFASQFSLATILCEGLSTSEMQKNCFGMLEYVKSTL